MVFPVVLCGYESWTVKIPEHWKLMLLNCGVEKTVESPLHSKEIKPAHPVRNQSWIFIRETDAEIEASILCPPDAKNRLIGKDPDTGKDWW